MLQPPVRINKPGADDPRPGISKHKTISQSHPSITSMSLLSNMTARLGERDAAIDLTRKVERSRLNLAHEGNRPPFYFVVKLS